jgi:protein SCO1/2
MKINSNLCLVNVLKKTLGFLLLLTLSFAVAAIETDHSGQLNYSRIVAQYDIPDLKVTRLDGKEVRLLDELNDGRPIIINFIFTSCSAICPMLSQVFMHLQNKLADQKIKAHLISVSIDPENDTPKLLAEYAKKFKAGPDWSFYTGSLEASIVIQKAFNVYRGDKMNHASVVIVRTNPDKDWLRIEGFIDPDSIIYEIHSN